MDIQEIIGELDQFIRNEILAKPRMQAIQAEENLLSSGILTSMSVFQLLTFISQRFGVQLKAQEIVAEHFQTLQTLAQRIQARRASTNK